MLYNWPIIGHERQLKFLENELKEGKLTHAYLFAGPSKIGKFRVAKTFANILQCENNFCHTCTTCIQMQKGSHIDTMEWKDATNESIKIETIREMIAHTNLSAQSRYKIIIIENIERLTIEAMNCLLKTLEEPQKKVVFILTTSNLKKIKKTILSRVRMYKFHSISEEVLKEKLKELYPEVSQTMLKNILYLSFGRPGQAVSLIEDTEYFEMYQKISSDLESLIRLKDMVKKIALMEEISKEKAKIQIFLDIFIVLARNILLKMTEKLMTNEESARKMNHLLDLIQEIEKTKELIEKNVNERLALENLILKL